ncbi:MAG: hypothetical protein R3E69_13640 [Steroidobacteraceae bacterium]|nr:hypothetical protein [Fimbriimonadaceae bacterium]
MSVDKKTIGIAKGNLAALASLVESGNFASELDAAKFAMAYAVRSGVSAGATEGADTKWNVGSVDPDGSLRSLIEALYPDVAEPYRLAEYFMNEGVKILASTQVEKVDVYDALFAAG